MEIFDPATDTLQRLENFRIDGKPGHPQYIGQYPHLWWMPSGHALVAGPRKSDNWLFHPPTPGQDDASSTDLPDMAAHRQWATGALLGGTADGGSTQAMLFGGADVDERALTPPVVANATTTRFDDVTGTWSAGPLMHAPRAFANGVNLPDGRVAVVGGGTGDTGNDWNYRWHGTAAQKRIDLYDPVSDTFTYGNAQAEARTYHSTALLLPDARVLSMGDDINGPTGPGSGTATDTAETWTPPYLLNADGSARPRPSLTSAPVAVDYGQPFIAGTPDAVTRAVLVAPGADTHATDMSQRIVELSAPVPTSGGVALTAPGSANLAPPGFYMLFLLDAQGTPSTARFVQIGADPPPPPAPTVTPGPSPVPTASSTPTPAPTPAPKRFSVKVVVEATTRRRVRRTGRLTVRVKPNRAARVRLTVGRTRRTLTFTGAVRRVAHLKLSRKARKRVKRTLVLRVRAVPSSGAPLAVTRRIKLALGVLLFLVGLRVAGARLVAAVRRVGALGLRAAAAALVLVGVLDARRVVRRLRVGRAARDRVALEVLGVVDLLALDRDAAVLVVADVGRAELGGRALLPRLVGVAAADGAVLGGAVRPVLELLGRVLLDLLHLLVDGVGVHRLPLGP